MFHAEVSLEQRMLSRFPAAEVEELAGYFRGYGADPETAARMAAAVSADPDTALQVRTRHELGVDPRTCPPRCWRASLRCSPSRPGHWCRCCATCSARQRSG